MDNGQGKRILVALMAGITVIIVGICMVLLLGRDKTPPEITFSDDTFVYKQGMSRDDLLSGVTASDNKDGDVTDQIIVENVAISQDGATADITYVVTDSSKNVTKKVREVSCDGVIVQETTDTSEEEQSTEEPTDGNEAEDTETSGQDADQEEDEEDTPVNPEAPVITLTDKELTIARGSSFSGLKYVQEITDDKDERRRLYNNIQIQGHVDTSTPGEYVLTYFVTDSDGNRSNEAELKVTVQ